MINIHIAFNRQGEPNNWKSLSLTIQAPSKNKECLNGRRGLQTNHNKSLVVLISCFNDFKTLVCFSAYDFLSDVFVYKNVYTVTSIESRLKYWTQVIG